MKWRHKAVGVGRCCRGVLWEDTVVRSPMSPASCSSRTRPWRHRATALDRPHQVPRMRGARCREQLCPQLWCGAKSRVIKLPPINILSGAANPYSTPGACPLRSQLVPDVSAASDAPSRGRESPLDPGVGSLRLPRGCWLMRIAFCSSWTHCKESRKRGCSCLRRIESGHCSTVLFVSPRVCHDTSFPLRKMR